MKTRTFLAGLVLALGALGFQPARFVSSATLPTHLSQVDCEAVFRLLTQDANWLDHLIDPVLDTPAKVEEQLGFYAQAHACIPAGASDATLKTVRELTEYFLIFAGGYQTPENGSAFSMVNLANSDDPAVTSLRQQVGIAAPPGYVYVRYYDNRQEMPGLVKQAFANADVRGVTIYTRYVAVLAENSALEVKILPKTVSHELVHAFLKSVQGVKNMAAFPTWYDEGMAIQFSGSSRPSCVYTTNGEVNVTSCDTSPENYIQYAANFEYLHNKLGQEKFDQVLQYSFTHLDPAVLYQAGGFTAYDEFAVRARDWKKWQDFIPKAEIGGACIVPFFLFLVIWFWRQVQDGSEEKERNLAYSHREIPPAGL